MISISKAEHLPSFWNRGLGELGNGLFSTIMHSLRPGKLIVRGKSRNFQQDQLCKFEGKAVNSAKQENQF